MSSYSKQVWKNIYIEGISSCRDWELLQRSKWIPLVDNLLTLWDHCIFLIPRLRNWAMALWYFTLELDFSLGILTLMDDGLELALGFHAANNLITALLVTADWTAFQTDSILQRCFRTLYWGGMY